jgi:hypothetical protein
MGGVSKSIHRGSIIHGAVHFLCMFFPIRPNDMKPPCSSSLSCFSFLRPQKPPGATLISWEKALSLYDLQHSDFEREETTDTHAVLGWGPDALVVAFRGTASMANVATDLKAWAVRYQPPSKAAHREGLAGWVGKVPDSLPVRVHGGFYGAWRGAGFSRRLLSKVQAAIDAWPSLEGRRVLLTGHSLGGALAALAAFEIKRANPALEITCYTYGAPKVGNRAFARAYAGAVPDTWGLINLQDPIARIPKWPFQRSCERVVLMPHGDIMVRPSYFEVSLFGSTGGSAKQHMVGAYRRAIAELAKAQFVASRSLPGGKEGVEALASTVELETALQVVPMDVASLKDPGQELKLMPEPKAEPKAEAEAAQMVEAEMGKAALRAV